MSKLLQALTFIITNWTVIKNLVTELLKLFDGDKEKVNECLNGICEAAQKLPAAEPVAAPKQEKLKVVKEEKTKSKLASNILLYILSKYKK